MLCAIARFYGLNSLLHFDVDEATHTQIITNIFEKFDLVAKGPPASSGETLYHGAFYYYLYLPFGIIGNGNPLYLSIFTIILSIASIPLLYLALERAFGGRVAFFSTIFYGLSSSVILYSRWIWNPNSIPFFFILALFALSRINEKRGTYLVLLFFAISCISQLHFGSMLLPVLILLLLPWLLKMKFGLKAWMVAICAFLIPWLPTIYYEIISNFELLRGLLHMSDGTRESLTLIDRIMRSYNYFIFMFDNINRLSSQYFILSILTLVSMLVLYIRKPNKQANGLVAIFLLGSLVYIFLVCAAYSGILHIHFVEEIFVLMAITLGSLVAQLSRNKFTILAAIFITCLAVSNNYAQYKKEIIGGKREFETHKKVCQKIEDTGDKSALVFINGKENPNFIKYICQRFYGIDIGEYPDNTYYFETDFKNKFNSSRVDI